MLPPIASDSQVDRSHERFDPRSGNRLELLIFNHRPVILAVCAILTMVLAWFAVGVQVTASYTSMLPRHQFVRNYEANRGAMRGLGDSVRIVVENKAGTVYDPHYLAVLQKINDAVFLLPGVDRSFMKSLWMPGLRWTAVTEQGAAGGPVMPPRYRGTASDLQQLQANIRQAGIIGSIVSNDQKSSVIFVPLLDRDPTTGRAFDYGQFERQLRDKARSLESATIGVHIVGFAQIQGVLIAALHKTIGFFILAAAISALLIFSFTRCVRSTATILFCSLIAVTWLLGVLGAISVPLDPYSILVPFLVFAIGVSHGAQKMNGIMQDIGRGAPRHVAARLTFRRLFIAGLTALVADAVGFAVLTVIDIPAIRALALTASLGVSLLVFTNLVLLPVMLSYVGVSRTAAARSLETGGGSARAGMIEHLFRRLELLCERRWAITAVTAAAVLLVAGYWVGADVKIGDVSAGAPELRKDSVYNRDSAYVIRHYSLSNDQFAVIVRTPENGLDNFESLTEMDRLGQTLRAVRGVQTTVSAADFVRVYTAASFEGDLKWWTIPMDPHVLGPSLNNVNSYEPELVNSDYSAAPVIIYLTDHKATTLTAVTEAARSFSLAHSTQNRKFLLAAGNAGMAAATNIVVARANLFMPYLVYAAVLLLCFISFRNWRAVMVAIVPLILTSTLCQALMVMLGIGVKVATLPVIALGVGIGVDYALYLLSVQLAFQRNGDPLRLAYRKALRFTGRIVALVGFTLAAGVSLWVFSPIQFQADMGILLTFMFLWNMVGALVLIPALSYFLLQTRWVARTATQPSVREMPDRRAQAGVEIQVL
ncbi:MAG: efflux RND transporter permease subunit [Janthinobacterium lividum]